METLELETLYVHDPALQIDWVHIDDGMGWF